MVGEVDGVGLDGGDKEGVMLGEGDGQGDSEPYEYMLLSSQPMYNTPSGPIAGLDSVAVVRFSVHSRPPEAPWNAANCPAFDTANTVSVPSTTGDDFIPADSVLLHNIVPVIPLKARVKPAPSHATTAPDASTATDAVILPFMV